MNKYELALVLSPALDEEGRAAEVAKVQATLERFGAKIEKVDVCVLWKTFCVT